jgi:hypothetical protein
MSPGFIAIALFVLALGTGAASSIFALAYARLHPLPFADPAARTMLWEQSPRNAHNRVSR